MRLKELRIENFRSFEDERIILEDYSCFVGPNGAGKSTILTALNVFFRNNSSTSTDVCKLSEEDFHHKVTKNPIKITLEFTDLTDEEIEEFKHYYRQDKLILFAQARWDENKQCAPVTQHGVRLVIKEFKEFFEAMDDTTKKVADLREIYNRIKKNFPELPAIQTKAGMEGALREYEENHKDLCGPLEDNGSFYGWTKGTNKLRKYIEWVYVPAVKDASTEQDESSKSALGQLLERTIRTKIDFKKPIGELKKEVEDKYKNLLSEQEGTLTALADSLKSKLQEWSSPDAKLNLKWHYDNEKSIDIKEPNARALIGEGGFIGEVARLGHGMQRAFLVTILQELAESNLETSPLLILGIEEPELYQHPPQARHMANLLINLTEDGKKRTQIITSTHSPHFVSVENFHNIRVVKKNKNEISKVTWTNFEKLEERISKATGDKLGTPSSLMARINQFLFPSHKELFFSSIPNSCGRY